MKPLVWMQRAAAVLLVIVVAGCQVPPVNPFTPAATDTDAGAAAVKSDQARLPASAAEAEVDTLVEGNTAFAFDLYRQIRSQPGNLFYSPYSISLALAMTEAGAAGETQAEMKQALHFEQSEASLHPAFNTLDQQLKQRAEQVVDPEQQPFELHIANALWGQTDYPIRPAYLDLLAKNFGAGMRLVDFVQAPEPARQAINDWVEEQTNDKIRDLVPEGAITTLTRLVLANAIYFNAAWLNPFDEEMTAPGDFQLLSGETASVPMMRQVDHFGYARGMNYQTVELPYVSRDLVMNILLPDEGQLEAVELALSGDQVQTMLDSVQYTQVDLSMPRFEYDGTFSLGDTLKGLGMEKAFDPDGADFSGITDAEQLYIQEVLHKAYVRVDEAGTEAAAATAVLVGAAGMPPEPIEVKVDRPFLFLIRDLGSGTILFVGRVVQP